MEGDIGRAVANAINTFPALQAENAKLRDALHSCLGVMWAMMVDQSFTIHEDNLNAAHKEGVAALEGKRDE